MSPPRHCNVLRRIVGVALLALLLGQWTVLAHSIAHAGTPSAGAAVVSGDPAWGHDADTPTCQLVDHLLTGQMPGGDAATACQPPPAASRAAAPPPSIIPRAATRAYEARGPPRA